MTLASFIPVEWVHHDESESRLRSAQAGHDLASVSLLDLGEGYLAYPDETKWKDRDTAIRAIEVKWGLVRFATESDDISYARATAAEEVATKIVMRLRAASYECQQLGQVYACQRLAQAAAELEAEFCPNALGV